MFKLKRLKIIRYRHAVGGCELHFGDGANILLGLNATGKTTLLNLIAAVTSHDLSLLQNDKDGFDLEYDIQIAEDKLLKFRTTRIPFGPSNDRELRMALLAEATGQQFVESASLDVIGPGGSFHTELQHGHWTHLPEVPPVTLCDYPWFFRAVFAEEPKRILGDDSSAIFHLLSNSCPRLDESTTFLDTTISTGNLIINYGPNTEPAAWPSPGVPLEVALRAKEALTRQTDNMGTGELLIPVDFLPTQPISGLDILGFERAVLSMRPQRQEVKGLKTTIVYSDFSIMFRRPALNLTKARRGLTEVSYNNLSYGQKRMFGFLWYVSCRGELPLVVDELANGLHHNWISACADLIESRQSIIATQHPLLVDYMPDDAVFIRCDINEDQEMTWTNLPKSDAQRMKEARARGIMQLSEILRSQGLW
ncbi:MAG: ATP-binding protein [Myxococcaceae bacterium]|jgi:hypothetical protein|nr:ATP-binding protein [Myxococcaceae bacterium]